MPLPLSIESQIGHFLTKYDLSADRFCLLAGPVLSTTHLSRALNDVRPLDFAQTEAAQKLMASIDRLVQLAEPLPLSLRNPAIVAKLLKAMADGSLKINVEIDATEWAEK